MYRPHVETPAHSLVYVVVLPPAVLSTIELFVPALKICWGILTLDVRQIPVTQVHVEWEHSVEKESAPVPGVSLETLSRIAPGKTRVQYCPVVLELSVLIQSTSNLSVPVRRGRKEILTWNVRILLVQKVVKVRENSIIIYSE